jgi:hypothetical protein
LTIKLSILDVWLNNCRRQELAAYDHTSMFNLTNHPIDDLTKSS